MGNNVQKRVYVVPPIEAQQQEKDVSPYQIGEPGPIGPQGPPGPPGKDASAPRGFSFEVIRDDLGVIIQIVATPL